MYERRGNLSVQPLNSFDHIVEQHDAYKSGGVNRTSGEDGFACSRFRVVERASNKDQQRMTYTSKRRASGPAAFECWRRRGRGED
ncbi:unnamed protein product [Heligmosomoides polygyrus]|uniref:Uncharacterized protein n=1 Tax=Heligmosomoides polygyrus TaxID=6339 RepID=A0A183GU44_HELPZ|nr:unnamed protein product [Heligmosomoides polygyrus]